MTNRLFFTQKIHKIHLQPGYLPESFSFRILGLKDTNNNNYALYKSDFLPFSKYLRENNLVIDELTSAEILELISSFNQQQSSPQHHLKLIKYFSPDYLSRFLLDPERSSFGQESALITVSSLELMKGGHQNCTVMHKDGSIYVHPKIRGGSSPDQFGVNHTSLAPPDGSAIAFAGSFVHTVDNGWILENTTGHYGSRATQMRNFVAKLKEIEFDLSPLTIKLWIPKNPKNPSDKEEDYTIIKENADEFLERTSRNMLRLGTY
jgi:hypothetical protein